MTNKKAIAYLATIMKDGSPQVTPVWFNFDGEYIFINSAEGRIKDRNMRSRPIIAITIQDPGDPLPVFTIARQSDRIFPRRRRRPHRCAIAQIYRQASIRMAKRERKKDQIQSPNRQSGCALSGCPSFLRSRRSIRRFSEQPVETRPAQTYH